MIEDKNIKIFGFNNYLDELIELFNANKIPNKLLISGKSGIGKTTFSFHLINYIFSLNEEFKYDLNKKEINPINKSFSMMKKKIHPNFFNISVKQDKKNIDILQIREMINFINKSSFDNKFKIILIENIEYLNNFSANALLKSIEEPNEKVIFILLYNNEHQCLDTIKSRCIEYKIKLDNKYIGKIVDYYFNKNIFENISPEFKNYYCSPSIYINFIKFCLDYNLKYQNISITEFINFYINNSLYKKNNIIDNNIKFYIECYFRNKMDQLKNIELINLYNYFNKKYESISKFNLDRESFYIELKSKVFNE